MPGGEAAEGQWAMRVLLIEDDPILGAAVRDQIAAGGHTVDWATRLEGARDCVRYLSAMGWCCSTSCCRTGLGLIS